jgi:hypothetical protein
MYRLSLALLSRRLKDSEKREEDFVSVKENKGYPEFSDSPC